jgi:hypothetical protein
VDEVFGKHSGLLTATLSQDEIDASDFRRSDSRFHGPELNRNLAQIDTLRSIADVMGATVGQLALACGCSAKARTSSRFRAPAAPTASGRTQRPRTSASPRPNSRASKAPSPAPPGRATAPRSPSR